MSGKQFNLGDKVRILYIQDAEWDMPTFDESVLYGKQATLISSGICEGEIVGKFYDGIDFTTSIKVRSRRTGEIHEVSDLTQLELIET